MTRRRRRAASRRPPAVPGRAGAFTTVELLVTIGLITLLLSVLVIGLRYAAGSTQERQTRVLMENCRNLLGEATADRAARDRFFQIQLPAIYNTTAAAANGRTDLDLTTAPLDGPAQDDPFNAAYVNAVRWTYFPMRAILNNTRARSAYDALPADRKARMPAGTYQNPRVARQEFTVGADGRPDPAPLIDGWGQPILFVPDGFEAVGAGGVSGVRLEAAGGIAGIRSDAAKQYWGAVEPAPPGVTGYARVDAALRAPDRRPFWVSAGPDGDFRTHDDNIYSFEN